MVPLEQLAVSISEDLLGKLVHLVCRQRGRTGGVGFARHAGHGWTGDLDVQVRGAEHLCVAERESEEDGVACGHVGDGNWTSADGLILGDGNVRRQRRAADRTQIDVHDAQRNAQGEFRDALFATSCRGFLEGDVFL